MPQPVTTKVLAKLIQNSPSYDDLGCLLLPNSVESITEVEKKKTTEHLNAGSSTSEAGTVVETYDGKEKEKGTVIDAEYNNNNGDIHPIVKSWGLQGGIHHNNNIDTRVEPRDGGKLVTRNNHGVFRAAGGSIESTNEVTKGRTGHFVQEELEPKMYLEINLIIEPDSNLKASHGSMSKDCHYTKFRQHMEHSFVHVIIRLTCDPQGTKLHVKVWDPRITGGDMLKQHLADKVLLRPGLKCRTKDLEGSRTTQEVADALISSLE
ncbi:hypothetical protein Tco_1336204 [Tanacetum coccineum]